ncbi:MAG TPA: histidine kinase [Casimicrobiaceae bacterium]|nr:histidine kinase [Casimicrobiaceae bacterium]
MAHARRPPSRTLHARSPLARTLHGFTWRRFALFCGIVAVATLGNAIAIYLSPKPLQFVATMFAWQYAHLFIFFGTVCAAVLMIGNWAPARTLPRVLTLLGAVVVGLLVGNQLIHAVAPMSPSEKDATTLLKEISGIVLWSHVIAAGVLGYFFFTREEDAVARLHEEDMRGEALTRELAEARLLVMQAQVEPHFLFNTLANVRRLFKTDPAAARAMLDHLSRYLGAMLPRMRQTDSTLGHELTLALAYLEVQKIRMGARLTIRSDVPEALERVAFPPMMLVTLVENAIRHGLTPLPEGGEVRIHARTVDGKLRVQVADTGAGLSESSGPGVGLANVRARLTTLYGGNARFLLAQNPGKGVIATIELPASAEPRASRAA